MTRSHIAMPLLDDVVDVGGGSPAAAIPAAPAAPATVGASAPQVATPPGSPAPAIGGAPEGMVPSYRLREAREAAERQASDRYNAQIAQIRGEADRYKTQLQALVGVQAPQNPQEDAIKSQFYTLFPRLKEIEASHDQLQQIMSDAQLLRQQNEHYWTSYARTAMDRLYAHAQESLGSPLTDEGKRALHNAFTGFVSSSPELTARFEQDPSLVEEFWKMFTSSFVDPVRRSSTATVAGRTNVALPQDTPSGAPRVQGAPQPKNLDDRADAAWQLFNTLKSQQV